jgi:DNA-binding MarR family transcriptional regulator
MQLSMKATTNRAKSEPKDFVDHLVDQWSREQPQLETTVAAIVVRMKRATAIFDAARERLARLGGLHGNELMLLDALRRSGPPYCLKPGVLMRELLIPSGTATRWIDSIEQRRLIRRLPDPNDRRGIIIMLTPLGHRAIQRIDKAHGFRGSRSPEHAALAGIGPPELKALSSLLRKTLIALEGPAAQLQELCNPQFNREDAPGASRNRRNVRVPRRAARRSPDYVPARGDL